MSIALNPPFGSLSPSSTLFINEEVNRLWQAGEQVFHLGFGESRFGVHPKLRAKLGEQASQKSYLPALGLPELRAAVAAYYSQKLMLDIHGDQVIIGPGSKALIYSLQMALDADLYLPTPSWVSYAPQARILGKAVHYIPSRVEDGHRFDLRAFHTLLKDSGSRQKLLIINSPNNPTGQMLEEGFLEELAAYCRENRILVISDEIYFLVNHGKTKHVSLAKYYPEGTFILGGLSKHLSLGGWRLGVAVLPDHDEGRKLMGALRAIASETWSAVSSPLQYAALSAYRGDEDIEAYIKTCADIHGIRSRHLYRCLTELGVVCTEPQGAFYLTANFDRWSESLVRKGISNSGELAEQLLRRQKIATLSADSFGIPRNTLSLRLASSYLDMEAEGDSQRLITLYRQGLPKEEFMAAEHHPQMNACIKAFKDFISWTRA